MQFAAIAVAVGLAGTLLVSNLQGAVIAPGDDGAEPALNSVDADTRLWRLRSERVAAMRLIDLKRGLTCRLLFAQERQLGSKTLTVEPGCRRSGILSDVASSRTDSDGTLTLADEAGRTIVAFAPGDGVLYESVYPSDELLTIISAR